MLTQRRKKLLFASKSSAGGPAEPLARIQATPKSTTTNTTSIASTFSVAPSIGNGIIVATTYAPNAATNTDCVDNQGNTYSLVCDQPSVATINCGITIYYCPAIIATSLPFIVTVNGTSMNRLAVAMEVSGRLAVDQVATSNPNAVNPIVVGPTTALTSDKVFLVGVIAVGGASSIITVNTATPAWTQEVESLLSTPVTAEVDWAVKTSALGTTAGANWTIQSSAFRTAAAVVAFTEG
jgi:hypothetical protein